MEGLLIVLGGSGMLAFFFAIWLNTRKGKKWLANLQCTFHWKYEGIMDALGFIFTVGIVVVGGIYLWTFTKRGKKWLESL